MSDTFFSRSLVQHYAFISRQFEPRPAAPSLTKEPVREIPREIIALSLWDETYAE